MRALLFLVLAGCTFEHRFPTDGDAGVPADAMIQADAGPNPARGVVRDIPAGTFEQGQGVPDSNVVVHDALPYRQTYLSGYRIQEDRVSQAQYQACIDAQVCDSVPVEEVSVEQATRFCHWLGMRLPTEAEWERAARGDQGQRFPWGDLPGGDPAALSPWGVKNTFGLPTGEWVATGYRDLAYHDQPWANPAEHGVMVRGLGPEVWYRLQDVPTPGDHQGFRCAESIDDGAPVPDPPAPPACGADCQVLELVAGRDHACARRAGDVVCWGRNHRGQLGTGDHLTLRGSGFWPVALPGSASKLVAGDEFTCALVGGVVHCWGSDDYGQLGASIRSEELLPVEVALDLMATDLGAARNHACALLSDGTVRCWGGDDLHLLGTMAAPERWDLPALFGASRIAVGEQVVCGLVNGDAVCTGLVPEGGLIIEIAHDESRTFSLGATPFVELQAGERHVCGRTAVNDLYCWGDGVQGQLGGSFTVRDAPEQLATLNVAAFALRGPITLAVRVDGLPLVATNLPGAPPSTMVPPLGPGVRHACVMPELGVQPFCFGNDDFAQAPGVLELP